MRDTVTINDIELLLRNEYGDPHSVLGMHIVSKDGKNIVLYIWYDNEYGYSHQVIRLAKYIAKVRRFTYY